MSNLELSAYVEEQLVENPMLEARDQAADTSDFDDEPQRETREAAPLLNATSADVLGEDAGFGRQLEASDTKLRQCLGRWQRRRWRGQVGKSSGLIWENRGGTGGSW